MASGSTSNATPSQHVLALKKSLSTAVQSNDVEGIKGALNRLKSEVVVTEDLIRETKIGIAVNKLRQNKDAQVADLAKEIIKKWKSDVGSSTSSKSKQPAVAAQHRAGSSAAQSPSPAPANAPSPAPASNTPKQDSTEPPSASTSNTKERRHSIVQRDTPRTAKSDGVKFDSSDPDYTHDKAREKCAELIYDALASDSDAPIDLILKRARALEQHVYDQNEQTSSSKQYTSKMRSLYMNLKAANNPVLRADVVSGDISIQRLYNMSPAEMASEEQQAINRKLVEENLFKAQGAAPQQAETDAFQCGKCKKRRTMYYQMQTRSADEPMTTFVTCLNCNNRWKFS